MKLSSPKIEKKKKKKKKKKKNFFYSFSYVSENTFP